MGDIEAVIEKNVQQSLKIVIFLRKQEEVDYKNSEFENRDKLKKGSKSQCTKDN